MSNNSKEWRPRLSVEITPEQSRSLTNLIPHGMIKPLFRALVDDVIEMTEKHGEMFLAAVIARQLKLKDFSRLEVRG